MYGCVATSIAGGSPSQYPAQLSRPLENREMKRFVVLLLIVSATISASGCRRGMRLWGCRGARCGNPWGNPYAMAPPPAYVPPAYPPAYAVCPPASVCPTVTCCPCCPTDCSVISEGDCGGTIMGDPGYSSGGAIETTPMPAPSGSGTID
jgi:hypothetical protein